MADEEPRSATAAFPPRDLVHRPSVRLHGKVDDAMLDTLLDGLAHIEDGQGPFALELCTLGGDAEVARRMVLEIGLARERASARRLIFIGKTVVYSAGATIMGAFPREDRFITADSLLLIHCRQLDRKLDLSGPMRGSLPEVEALCAQLKLGCEMEVEGFERLIADSEITVDEVLERALHNWYLTAEEALERRLVAGLL